MTTSSQLSSPPPSSPPRSPLPPSSPPSPASSVSTITEPHPEAAVLIRLLLALDTDEDLRDGLDDELKARGIKHCLLCESLPRLFCSGTVRWQTPPFAYSEDLKKGWVMAKNGDVVRRSEFGSSSV